MLRLENAKKEPENLPDELRDAVEFTKQARSAIASGNVTFGKPAKSSSDVKRRGVKDIAVVEEKERTKAMQEEATRVKEQAKQAKLRADIAVAHAKEEKAQEKKDKAQGKAPKKSQAKEQAKQQAIAQAAQAAQSKVVDHTISEAPPVEVGNDMRNTQPTIQPSDRVEEVDDEEKEELYFKTEKDAGYINDIQAEASNPLAADKKTHDSADEYDDAVDVPLEPSNPLAHVKPRRTMTQEQKAKMKAGRERVLNEKNEKKLMAKEDRPAPIQRTWSDILRETQTSSEPLAKASKKPKRTLTNEQQQKMQDGKENMKKAEKHYNERLKKQLLPDAFHTLQHKNELGKLKKKMDRNVDGYYRDTALQSAFSRLKTPLVEKSPGWTGILHDLPDRSPDSDDEDDSGFA